MLTTTKVEEIRFDAARDAADPCCTDECPECGADDCDCPTCHGWRELETWYGDQVIAVRACPDCLDAPVA